MTDKIHQAITFTMVIILGLSMRKSMTMNSN